jgi:hypothetical protein
MDESIAALLGVVSSGLSVLQAAAAMTATIAANVIFRREIIWCVGIYGEVANALWN